MVATVNTAKYTIENDLTKKRKKENKQTNMQTNGMYLSKAQTFDHDCVSLVLSLCDE